MAIAFDAASNSGYQSGVDNATWNHTVSGSNPQLEVGVGLLSVAGTTVTGITFNGVALTKIRHQASVSGACRVEKWKIDTPATGTHAIAVQLSAAAAWGAGGVSSNGAAGSSSVEADAGAQGTNIMPTDATVSLTTSTDNTLLIDAVASTDTSISVGAGQTERVNVTGALGSFGMSTKAKAAAGIDSMSWTNVGGGATWAIEADAVKPYVAQSPVAGQLLVKQHVRHANFY